MATALSVLVPTFWAILRANAVFPTAGRAAKIINSSACNPAVILSNAAYPVGKPVISSSFRAN